MAELGIEKVAIAQMHNIVEGALERVNPTVAKSYRDYRNYKQDFVQMLDEVYTKSQSIMYIGDKENANTDSALVSTKRSLIFNEFNRGTLQEILPYHGGNPGDPGRLSLYSRHVCQKRHHELLPV